MRLGSPVCASVTSNTLSFVLFDFSKLGTIGLAPVATIILSADSYSGESAVIVLLYTTFTPSLLICVI